MENLLSKLPISFEKAGWPWTRETDPSIYSNRTDWPKITIITPSYNQGVYIEETIRSILLQNYPNLEYIIIDGGSTDSTKEVLEKYDKWISHWVSEKDEGQSDAINKGLRLATGDLFNWINSDDILCEKSLFYLATEFDESIDVYLLNLSIASNDTTNIVKIYRQKTANNIAETIVDHLIAQPSTFYRLKVIKHLGGIATNFHFVMDLFLWVRYLLEYGQKKTLVIPKSAAVYREHKNTKTALLTENFEKETIEVLRFACAAIKDKKNNSNVNTFIGFKLGLSKTESLELLSLIRQRNYFLFKKNILKRNFSLSIKYLKEFLKTFM